MIREEAQNGQCLNNNELVHLDPDIRSTEGFIASSMFGAGAGPAAGSKHCQQELLNNMREMHEACTQITARVRPRPRRSRACCQHAAAVRAALHAHDVFTPSATASRCMPRAPRPL